jgi:hypothetical protein
MDFDWAGVGVARGRWQKKKFVSLSLSNLPRQFATEKSLLSRLQTTPAGAHLLSSQRCGGFSAGDLPFIPVWSSTRNMAAPPIPSRWNMVFTVDTAVHRGYCTHGPCFHFRLTDWTVGSMVIPRKIRFHRFVTSTIEGSAVLVPNFV